MQMKVLLEQDEDGWYTASVPNLPGCISQGETIEEAKLNIRDAIRLYLEVLQEEGRPLPESEEKVRMMVVEVDV